MCPRPLAARRYPAPPPASGVIGEAEPIADYALVKPSSRFMVAKAQIIVRRRGRETGNRAGGPGEAGLDGTMKGKEGSEVVGAGLRARDALVVVTVVALFTGCSSSEPPAHAGRPGVPGLQLPVFEKSCAPQPGPPSVVPIRVVSHGAVIVANVCIGGEGPFPFLVDTGGSTTLVDSSLAARLHLALVDGPRTVSSFTCKRQISYAAVSQWSVGNTTLLPQAVVVGTVRSPVLPNLDGVLASDTLSSFGAVRIDYRQQTLTLGPKCSP